MPPVTYILQLILPTDTTENIKNLLKNGEVCFDTDALNELWAKTPAGTTKSIPFEKIHDVDGDIVGYEERTFRKANLVDSNLNVVGSLEVDDSGLVTLSSQDVFAKLNQNGKIVRLTKELSSPADSNEDYIEFDFRGYKSNRLNTPGSESMTTEHTEDGFSSTHAYINGNQEILVKPGEGVWINRTGTNAILSGYRIDGGIIKWYDNFVEFNTLTALVNMFSNADMTDYDADATGKIVINKEMLLDVINSSAVTFANGFTFENADNTLSWDDGTRTLTQTPTGATFRFFSDSSEYNKAIQTIQIPDSEGFHFVYYNSSGTLVTTQVFDINIILKWAYVAAIYWDATNKTSYYVADERHSYSMDPVTHYYLHTTRGTAWESGLSLGDFTVDASGSQNSHAQFSAENGFVWDEDIRFTITDLSPQQLAGIAQVYVYSREGANGYWRRSSRAGFAVRTFDDTSGTRASYNEWTGTVWQQAQVSNGNYVLGFVYATTNILEPLMVIQGQAQYSTQDEARIGVNSEYKSLALGDISERELRLIGVVMFQTSNTYSNDVKSRIVSIDDEGTEYLDTRLVGTTSLGGDGGSSFSPVAYVSTPVELKTALADVTKTIIFVAVEKITLVGGSAPGATPDFEVNGNKNIIGNICFSRASGTEYGFWFGTKVAGSELRQLTGTMESKNTAETVNQVSFFEFPVAGDYIGTPKIYFNRLHIVSGQLSVNISTMEFDSAQTMHNVFYEEDQVTGWNEGILRDNEDMVLTYQMGLSTIQNAVTTGKTKFYVETGVNGGAPLTGNIDFNGRDYEFNGIDSQSQTLELGNLDVNNANSISFYPGTLSFNLTVELSGVFKGASSANWAARPIKFDRINGLAGATIRGGVGGISEVWVKHIDGELTADNCTIYYESISDTASLLTVNGGSFLVGSKASDNRVFRANYDSVIQLSTPSGFPIGTTDIEVDNRYGSTGLPGGDDGIMRVVKTSSNNVRETWLLNDGNVHTRHHNGTVWSSWNDLGSAPTPGIDEVLIVKSNAEGEGIENLGQSNVGGEESGLILTPIDLGGDNIYNVIASGWKWNGSQTVSTTTRYKPMSFELSPDNDTGFGWYTSNTIPGSIGETANGTKILSLGYDGKIVHNASSAIVSVLNSSNVNYTQQQWQSAGVTKVDQYWEVSSNSFNIGLGSTSFDFNILAAGAKKFTVEGNGKTTITDGTTAGSFQLNVAAATSAVSIRGGSSAAHLPLLVQNAAATANLLTVDGSGVVAAPDMQISDIIAQKALITLEYFNDKTRLERIHTTLISSDNTTQTVNVSLDPSSYGAILVGGFLYTHDTGSKGSIRLTPKNSTGVAATTVVANGNATKDGTGVDFNRTGAKLALAQSSEDITNSKAQSSQFNSTMKIVGVTNGLLTYSNMLSIKGSDIFSGTISDDVVEHYGGTINGNSIESQGIHSVDIEFVNCDAGTVVNIYKYVQD